MADWFETLAETHAEVWRRLTRGVADRRAAARHPVLATTGLTGFAEARVVVLRGAEPSMGRLEIHTDRASAKLAEATASPGATLLIWEERARLQIRLRAHLHEAPAEIQAERWARAPEGSRAVYRALPPPGTPIGAPFELGESSEPRFTVLWAEIQEIDTLHLGTPHRRALFTRADGWKGTWLAP
ncbi:MAG: pyridoxamine 5'-phosphate oxidase [Pseudomonadota bacterium]